jgi:hypothetical protein
VSVKLQCSLYIVLSASTQLNDDGEFNIDEELENVPPEILEEGHRVIKACSQTRTDFSLFTIYIFLYSVEITNKKQPCNRIYYSTVH